MLLNQGWQGRERGGHRGEAGGEEEGAHQDAGGGDEEGEEGGNLHIFIFLSGRGDAEGEGGRNLHLLVKGHLITF